jgi:hypothetical protein
MNAAFFSGMTAVLFTGMDACSADRVDRYQVPSTVSNVVKSSSKNSYAEKQF